jgi:hypothetical protein
MGHYRIYELDPSDHITAGYSVECGSDAAAGPAAVRVQALFSPQKSVAVRNVA